MEWGCSLRKINETWVRPHLIGVVSGILLRARGVQCSAQTCRSHPWPRHMPCPRAELAVGVRRSALRWSRERSVRQGSVRSLEPA